MLVNKDRGLLRLAGKKGLLTKELAEQLIARLEAGEAGADQLLLENGLAQDDIDELRNAQKATSIPSEFDGYRILGIIGKGGMSVVLKALHKATDQEVALKVLSPTIDDLPTSRERFHREIESVSKITHPNIIQCYGSGETNERPYLALEYMAKGDLANMMRKSGSAVPEKQALRIVLECAQALTAVAAHNMMHRDIKPENIFLDADGTAKLADLGLSKSADDDTGLTMMGKSVGTPAYMSPEQALGRHDVNIRTDIFSLGATLYQLVCGKQPFQAKTAHEVMKMVVKEEPTPVEEINSGLMPGTVAIIKAMMLKDPDQRYQRPEDLVADLRRLGQDNRQFDIASIKIPANMGSQEQENRPPPRRSKFGEAAATARHQREREEAAASEAPPAKKGFFARLFAIFKRP